MSPGQRDGAGLRASHQSDQGLLRGHYLLPASLPEFSGYPGRRVRDLHHPRRLCRVRGRDLPGEQLQGPLRPARPGDRLSLPPGLDRALRDRREETGLPHQLRQLDRLPHHHPGVLRVLRKQSQCEIQLFQGAAGLQGPQNTQTLQDS